MPRTRTPRPGSPRPRRLVPLSLALPLVLAACGGDGPDLVLYVAHDQVHSEPLVERFERETGLRVRAEYDVEANKTVGLVSRIREEHRAGVARCDVFWNNEIANTVALANDGLLAAYDSPTAADVPEALRDPERRWTGFAARARVLIVNTELVEEPDYPTGLYDLLRPWEQGSPTVARPLTGTTLTHAAALYVALGDDAARAFWEEVERLNERGQVAVVQSNGQTMRTVGEGTHPWGWTDTDDYNVALEKGYPVARVVPDQGEDGLGAVLIPNTVAILADAPHRANAERFVDWVLSREVEAELARGAAAQIPVRGDVARPAHVVATDGLTFLQVDWAEVGRRLPEIHAELKELFLD